jgi:hypothetical protein
MARQLRRTIAESWEQTRFILCLLLALAAIACSGESGENTSPTDLAGEKIVYDLLTGEVLKDDGGLLDVELEDLVDIYDPAICDPRLLEPGQVRAKPVVCDSELLTGPNADGQVGDLILENSKVRFIIRVSSSHTFVGMDGGNVVDADLARNPGEAGRDLLQEITPLFSFNAAALDTVEVTGDGSSGEAVVAVSGPAIGVPYLASLIPILPVLNGTITHEYALAADSNTLVLRFRISWEGDPGGSSVVPIDGFFASGALTGFELESTLGGSELLPALLSHADGISYGFLGSAGYEMTSIGAVALATGASIKVPTDGNLMVERYLVVGDGSVSSITGELARLKQFETGAITGCVEPGFQPFADGVWISAYSEEEEAITRFTVDEQGCFAGLLPPGPAVLRAGCAGCVSGEEVDIQVVADETTDGIEVPGVLGSRLKVTVSDKAGNSLPARLTLQPTEGGDTISMLAWPPDREFPLQPGSYHIVASRGFEYEISLLEELVISPGQTEVVALQLERSVDTPGSMSADFHIHSENSVDSFVPLPQRVRSIAAEGLEFIVATDHDFVTDYGPIIETEQLSSFLAATPGVEMSSVQAGHMNCWPMEVQASLSADGAFPWFGLPPGEIVEALRHDHPERVVQLNHPRFQDSSTFDLLQFNPQDGLAHASPEELGFPADTDLNDFNFDAIEVFNGVGDEELFEQLEDWYALLNLGYVIAAAAGGDSHDLKAYPGNPRNYLFVGEDDPSALTVEMVNDAVRAQRVLVTSGPYVEAGLIDEETGAPSLPGELVSDEDGLLDLWVKIQAPTWMEVTQLTLIRNGNVEQVMEIDDPGDPLLRTVERLDVLLPVQADSDCWFVVLVNGTQSDPNLTNHSPTAITNPFYVDANSNGQLEPPGL